MSRGTILGGMLLALLPVIRAQTFEVASIKPSPPYPREGGVYSGVQGGPGTTSPTRITWNFATLRGMICAAYNIRPNQLTGPDFLDSSAFHVAATVPEGATKEQVRTMWRRLLEERFGMMARVETKDFDVFELVIGRNGHKLQATSLPEDAGPKAGEFVFPKMENGKLKSRGMVATTSIHSGGMSMLQARGQTTAEIAASLAGDLGELVLDKTGLTGRYDFELEFMPQRTMLLMASRGEESGISLVQALEQTVGLRVQKARAELDHVIVDKIERMPTEN